MTLAEKRLRSRAFGRRIADLVVVRPDLTFDHIAKQEGCSVAWVKMCCRQFGVTRQPGRPRKVEEVFCG